MVEVGGVGDGLTPVGVGVGGFIEMISIKHFDLPEAPSCTSYLGNVRSGERVFLSKDARVQEC